MPRRLRFLLFTVLAACLGATDARAQDEACAPAPQVEIISQDDLMRHAVQHLSDIFTLSSTWHGTSIDGYHVQAFPGGLLPGNERWSVYVNDIPVATRLLGRNQLNALPVAIQDVACIELVAGPDLSYSSFSRVGAIRIHTKTPDFGLSIDGSLAAGNEINDPGPFRYTGTGGPNVDRIGPSGTGAVSVNVEEWTARASGRLEEVHVSDEVLHQRAMYHYNISSKPTIKAASLGITGSVGGASRRQRVLADASDTDDLAFFTSVGHEIPTKHQVILLGATGRRPVQDGALTYALAYTRSDLQYLSNRGGVDMNWGHDQLRAETEVRLHGLRLGGSLQATEGRTPARLTDPLVVTSRLFGGVGFDIVPAWRQDLVLEWKQRGNQPAAAGYAATGIVIGDRHHIALQASYGHQVPDDQDLWMWLARGFSLPDAGAIDVTPLRKEPLPRMATLDASWLANVTDRLNLRVRSYVRSHEDEYLPVYDIAYAPSTFGLNVQTALDGDVNGTIAGSAFTIHLQSGSRIDHRLTYAVESALTGDDAFHRRHDRVPYQRISYAATFAANDRFSVSAFIRYRASTTWREYVQAASHGDNDYLATFPEYFLVDLSATKRLWRDHIHVAVALKNVLDEPVRYHPAGAISHMALHFSVRVHLTSVAGF